MKKMLFLVGIGILVVIGAGCKTSSTTSVTSSSTSSSQTQVVDQNGCKTSTYKPASDGLDFSPTDCTFIGFGKQVTPSELDQASCKRISYFVIVDKNRVYKQLYDPGSSNSDQYTILKVDPATFVSLGFNYYKDAKNLYYDNGSGVRIIKGIDLNSLEVLETHYLKDKSHLYAIMPERSDKLTILNGFDVKTFAFTDGYAKDKNGIYFETEKTPGQLNAQRSKIAGINDAIVLADGKVIKGADPLSFNYLGGGFYKDNKNVYYEVGGFHQLSEIDGCSFELVGYSGTDVSWKGYSRDENHVYYYDVAVEGADPRTFKIDGERVFDKNGEYQGKNRK
jgi:hypothetical protein